jgi:hypothetical protein
LLMDTTIRISHTAVSRVFKRALMWVSFNCCAQIYRFLIEKNNRSSR